MNQADKTLLKNLESLDNLRILQAGNKKIFLHNEHRWVLPLLKWAQKSDALPQPCNLIMFDRHHDYKDISDKSKEIIRSISNSTIDPNAILDICNKTLCPTNGDWIKAGMELGCISDVLTIGAERLRDNFDSDQHTDYTGKNHTMYQLDDLVGALGHEGELADNFSNPRYDSIRQFLGWEKQPDGGFRFSKDHDPIWLDFDLDCFSVNWSDYIFPWPEKVWRGKITGESTYTTTKGMTGDWFIKKLIKRAGLITIAREPKHCGSEEESDQILERVNHYLFDNSIEL